MTRLNDIDGLAREVIRGDWGNGEERRRRLTDAGYNYDEVQRFVDLTLRDEATEDDWIRGMERMRLDMIDRPVNGWGNDFSPFVADLLPNPHESPSVTRELPKVELQRTYNEGPFIRALRKLFGGLFK